LATGLPTRFDVIVVGGGPAGAAASYTLARKGFKVLLIDRGRGPGSKTLYGGRVYAGPLREVWPDLDRGAPIHRLVKRERISLLTSNADVTIDLGPVETDSFTTYLPDLVGWMVSKSVEEGVVFVDEVRVDSLLLQDGKVVGVRAGKDTVYSDVVVDAEGVNRLLLERAGLVEPLGRYIDYLALGVKEVLKIGKKRLEEVFDLNDNEGLAWLFVGDITKGVPGGGFLYTFRDSVSLGVVVRLREATQKLRGQKTLQHGVYELVEGLRLHPRLGRYWNEGDIIEYGAHLTIEDPLSFMPKRLVSDGLIIVGDAAGLLLNTGYTIRGVDLAVYSGKLAADAIEKAFDLGDFSRESLAIYENMIKNSFIYRELKRHSCINKILKRSEIYASYTKAIVDGLITLYSPGDSQATVKEAFSDSLKRWGISYLSLVGLLFDVFVGC